MDKHINEEEDEKRLRQGEDEKRYVTILILHPFMINDAKVKPSDLYDREYREILQAIITLHNDNIGIDVEEIMRLSPNVSPMALGRMFKDWGLTKNFKLYEGRILRLAERERLRMAGMMIKERAETGKNISEDTAFALHQLEGLETGDETKDFTGADMAEMFREEMIAGPQKKDSIETHLPKLNYHTGGFQPGEFVVIGAFTNDGKSALKMNFAVEAAKRGHSVGIISLEDSVKKYRNRMLAYMSGVNGRILRDNDKDKLSESQSAALLGAESALAGMKIVAAHRAGMTISDIEAKTRHWKRKHDLKILFVDYIQIIENPGFRDYREKMMDTVLRLTALCRNLGIVLVTSSQINRDGETNPKLSNLAETSKIEHQADYVFLIEAKEKLIRGEKIRIPDQLVLAKGRDVPKGLKIPIHFDPDRLMFGQTDEE